MSSILERLSYNRKHLNIEKCKGRRTKRKSDPLIIYKNSTRKIERPILHLKDPDV